MAISTTPAALRLTELTKLFGSTRAVDRVSMSIQPGDMVAFLGPSGCGKTTTLRMIAGLVQPNAGEIFLDGRSITGVPVHRRNIGMLFQNYALFPHMTVAENIAFGLETRKLPRADVESRVAAALQLVQLTGYDDRMPGQLSGGQQQRVALAGRARGRAGALADEPPGRRQEPAAEHAGRIAGVAAATGVATGRGHARSGRGADDGRRIVIMRDGRIEQIGERPKFASVRRHASPPAFGASNFFRGTVEQSRNDILTVAVPGGPLITVKGARSVG